MNKNFNSDISPIKVTESELALINKFTVKELTADEVYAFNVVLCDNDIDRDGERFDLEALRELSERFVGKTGIFDHNPQSKNQTMRIYSACCEQIPNMKTTTGEDYVCVKARAYMPLIEKNADLIADINAGIKKEVSVSCSVEKVVCSICGQDAKSSACKHIKGEQYNGKLCHRILCGVNDAYEWSFVAIPAQVNAGVTKSYKKEIETMENCIKAIKDGEAVNIGKTQAKQIAEYIESLEKAAKDGEAYRRALTEETAKYAMLSVPSLTGDSVEKMCSGVATQELIKIRNAFRKKAEEVVPLAPQLRAKKDKNNNLNSEFKF